ncbi:holin [Morganella phage vB_Mm5]
MEENNKKQGLFVDLLDTLFKDAVTGEIVFYRIILLIIAFILAFIWYNNDLVFEKIKEMKFESYQEMIIAERERKFELVAREQLQIVHMTTHSSFSMVTLFKPKNLNYFADVVSVEGRVPSEFVGKEAIGGYPINKTSMEYVTHLAGLPYVATKDFPYMNSQNGYNYMFSCPYFNLDNIYSGTVYMFWDSKPDISYDNMSTICFQAARVIGRVQ